MTFIVPGQLACLKLNRETRAWSTAQTDEPDIK